MVARVPRKELRLLEEEGHRGRSDVYKYVRLNLATLVARGLGTDDGPSWEAFAEHLARCGLTNSKGGPVSRGSARQIFERARRDVEKAKQAAATAVEPPMRKRYPRDMPKEWRPRESVQPPSYAPAIRTLKGASDLVNNVNITPDEAMEGVMRVVHEASYGRAVPFPPRPHPPPTLTGPTADPSGTRPDTNARDEFPE